MDNILRWAAAASAGLKSGVIQLSLLFAQLFSFLFAVGLALPDLVIRVVRDIGIDNDNYVQNNYMAKNL